MLHVLYRLNPMFVFSKMHHTSSDDNIMYGSPSLSREPSALAPYRSPKTSVETATTARNSYSFRKFSSEPSLANTPRRSRCRFRERMKSDCLEEELLDGQRTDSDNHAESSECQVNSRKKLHHRHDRCHDIRHTQLKSHPRLRRPLSDCDARLNAPSTQQTLPSLSDEEIRRVCIDAFLER